MRIRRGMKGRRGLSFYILGIILLVLSVGGTLIELSAVRFGPIEVTGLSQFSAINLFVGLALILIGIVVDTGTISKLFS